MSQAVQTPVQAYHAANPAVPPMATVRPRVNRNPFAGESTLPWNTVNVISQKESGPNMNGRQVNREVNPYSRRSQWNHDQSIVSMTDNHRKLAQIFGHTDNIHNKKPQEERKPGEVLTEFAASEATSRGLHAGIDALKGGSQAMSRIADQASRMLQPAGTVAQATAGHAQALAGMATPAGGVSSSITQVVSMSLEGMEDFAMMEAKKQVAPSVGNVQDKQTPGADRQKMTIVRPGETQTQPQDQRKPPRFPPKDAPWVQQAVARAQQKKNLQQAAQTAAV